MEPAKLDEVFTKLQAEYSKPEDKDFPINKIRFLVDFLWNSVVKRPLTDEQKVSLKALIDLLNLLDEHKLSPTRDLIAAMTPSLTPLISIFPSLGHTFTLLVTTIVPSYQRYLTGLEEKVKESKSFSSDDVLLYYDLTLVDHMILSHIFESEASLNLLEVIETTKAVVVINALTHDYIQDASNASISLFTFMQRGGLAKDQTLSFYAQQVKRIVENIKQTVTNADCLAYIDYIGAKFIKLAQSAGTAPTEPQELPSPVEPEIPAQNPQPTTDVFSSGTHMSDNLPVEDTSP
ncbi:MAG TPA: hypothetical protein VLH19_05660 [Patescibacteria group bacterium]|nr:hypothetical protein [Patescibacteria group bacterium]